MLTEILDSWPVRDDESGQEVEIIAAVSLIARDALRMLRDSRLWTGDRYGLHSIVQLGYLSDIVCLVAKLGKSRSAAERSDAAEALENFSRRSIRVLVLPLLGDPELEWQMEAGRTRSTRGTALIRPTWDPLPRPGNAEKLGWHWPSSPPIEATRAFFRALRRAITQQIVPADLDLGPEHDGCFPAGTTGT